MKGARSRFISAVFVVVALALASCADATSPSTPKTSPSTFEAEEQVFRILASHLRAPWSMVRYQDWVLVSERDQAQIAVLGTDGTVHGYLPINGVRDNFEEGGLLGLAVDESDYLYVYSTTESGNRVQRFPLRIITDEVVPLALGPAEAVIEGIPAGPIHNGGRIAFGPDQKLYIATGDSGERTLPQDLSAVAGKILRVNPDGSIPEDNPFPDSPVYSLGHRNVQGLAWDSKDRLYASELGSNSWDELNLIVAGNNYGWPDVEGRAPTSGFIDPLIQWPTKDASPSGIAIHDDVVYVATLQGQTLMTVSLKPLVSTGEEVEKEYFEAKFGRLRDVLVHDDGSVWLLSTNTDGRGEPQQSDDVIIEIPAHVFSD